MRSLDAPKKRKMDEVIRCTQEEECKKVKVVSDGNKKKMNREFKEPEHEPEQFSKKTFAPKSKHKIMWAVNMLEHLLGSFPEKDLCYALSHLVREVKKIDGNEYPPNMLRELVIIIQMYLHENSVFWKLLDQPQFLPLCNVVHNTMKERHTAGLGVRCSSDIISLDNEDKLFNKGVCVLGDSNPEQLLKTVIYMIGMHCAL